MFGETLGDIMMGNCIISWMDEDYVHLTPLFIVASTGDRCLLLLLLICHQCMAILESRRYWGLKWKIRYKEYYLSLLGLAPLAYDIYVLPLSLYVLCIYVQNFIDVFHTHKNYANQSKILLLVFFWGGWSNIVEIF